MTRILMIALLTMIVGGYANAADADKPTAEAGTTVQRVAADAWCWVEDLPKSMCPHCDKKVILTLKKSENYCKEHNSAESLCRDCDPKAANALLNAMRPEAKDWPANFKPKTMSAEKKE